MFIVEWFVWCWIAGSAMLKNTATTDFSHDKTYTQDATQSNYILHLKWTKTNNGNSWLTSKSSDSWLWHHHHFLLLMTVHWNDQSSEQCTRFVFMQSTSIAFRKRCSKKLPAHFISLTHAKNLIPLAGFNICWQWGWNTERSSVWDSL